MSGAGSPTCRPESVHPRRPRGSQSGWEKRGARTWNGFRRAFSPDPTDRPWVSEDGISIACVAGAKRGGKGGARKAPLSPLPPSPFPFFPFSLFPYPLPVSTPATQARISTKSCRKIWSGKLILAARRWKSKQKNKTKNIYLNKLPNISLWKQTFFRGLKKNPASPVALVWIQVYHTPLHSKAPIRPLALHSFYVCRLSTNVPKLRKSTVLVMKWVRNFFNVWDIGSVHLLCKIGLIVDKVFRSGVTYEGQAEKRERTKEIAGSGIGLSPTYRKTCPEVTQPNPISY